MSEKCYYMHCQNDKNPQPTYAVLCDKCQSEAIRSEIKDHVCIYTPSHAASC